LASAALGCLKASNTFDIARKIDAGGLILLNYLG
jgi:hypothetical protein